MALREFRDRNGVVWRAWAVTPEFMHPATAAEDYLGDYQEGWLTFECQEARRRLPRIPRGWEALPDAELERLLESALQAPRRPPHLATGERPAAPPPSAPEPPPAAPSREAQAEMTPTGRRRIFSDPSGHIVIAGIERPPAPPAPQAASGNGPSCELPPAASVLRFRTDDKQVFDLTSWPEDWDRMPKPELIALYARARQERESEVAKRAAEHAARPVQGTPATETPRRRATDRLG